MNVDHLVLSDAVCVEFHGLLSLGKGRECISEVVAPTGKVFIHTYKVQCISFITFFYLLHKMLF